MSACLALKRFISEHGIKINYVARKAGISPELLRRSLAGSRKLTADELLAVCSALSLELDYFSD